MNPSPGQLEECPPVSSAIHLDERGEGNAQCPQMPGRLHLSNRPFASSGARRCHQTRQSRVSTGPSDCVPFRHIGDETSLARENNTRHGLINKKVNPEFDWGIDGRTFHLDRGDVRRRTRVVNSCAQCMRLHLPRRGCTGSGTTPHHAWHRLTNPDTHRKRRRRQQKFLQPIGSMLRIRD